MSEIKLSVYFAGSIRGATFEGKEACYQAIIDAIRDDHFLLSEHSAVTGLSEQLTDAEIFERDTAWIAQSEVMIAEVSAPSLGVGYEIAYALGYDLPILCLYKTGTRVSAMLTGNPDLQMADYESPEEAAGIVRSFLNHHRIDAWLENWANE